MLVLDENDSFEEPRYALVFSLANRDYNPLSCALRSVCLYNLCCYEKTDKSAFIQMLDLLKVVNTHRLQPLHFGGMTFRGENWYCRALFLR